MSTPASGESPHSTPEVQRYRPRACQSCARSKMRCAKTKAPCTLPELNPRKRRGPSTRVGQLEEKIDGIMSLLNASQQIQQSSHAATPESSRSGIQSLLNPVDAAAGTQETSRQFPMPSAFPNVSHSPSVRITDHSVSQIPPVALSEYVEIIPGFRMPLDEAERSLNVYRSVYTSSFPFVPIPAMISAYDLYTQSPLLFRVIMQATAPQSPSVQQDSRVWFRKCIAHHVLVEQEKRLEILQALLVHMAWSDFYFYFNSEATNLIQIAVGLIVELGFNRPPSALRRGQYSLIQEAVQSLPSLRAREEHTLDDMRATLGCFVFASVISTLFRRAPPFQYTPYLAQCCDTIENAHEYDSDRVLVILVRMQALLCRVAGISPGPGMDTGEHVAYIPLHMTMGTVHKELDTLVSSVPPDVERNAFVWTHYYMILMRLYEPAIYMRPSTRPSDPVEAALRTEDLWNCLKATRDWFASHSATPLDDLVAVPLLVSAELSFGLVTASRLLFLDEPDWDLEAARRSLDLVAVCKRICDKLDQADQLLATLPRRRKFVDEKPVLVVYQHKVRWIQHWYVTKTAGSLEANAAATSSAAAASGGGASEGAGQAMDLDQPLPPFVPSFELDESFWQALTNFDGRATWDDGLTMTS